MTVRGGAPSTPPNGPPPSAIQTAPNLVAFDPKLAVPSQPVYFQRNDFIAFNFNTNGVNIIVRINYRWLTPEGEIKEGEFDTAPFSAANFISFPLYEGWLLSFAARVTNGPVFSRWCFMQAFITRTVAGGAQSPIYSLFWSGFVYQFTANGWPGLPAKEIGEGPGVIRSVQGAATVPGQEVSEVVPAGVRWTLLSFRTRLTTNATVANRTAAFLVDDGLNTLYVSRSTQVQAASLAFAYTLSPGNQFFFDGVDGLLLPAPGLIPLRTGFRVRTFSTNLQAGDQYSQTFYEVIEWGAWDS